MHTVWEGWIVGVFEGYLSGRVYELSDSSRWRQEDGHAEYVYREQPKVKLLRDPRMCANYLDVEGTSGIVRVVPDRDKPRISSGAF